MEGDVVCTVNPFEQLNFYPRPPGGGRPDKYLTSATKTTSISIHALRVEGDLLGATTQNTFKFISIHALRVEGDGEKWFFAFVNSVISIHALRVEGDGLG